MNTAKLTLTEQPVKKPTAWQINIKDQGLHWIPFTYIQEYKPWVKEITIDTFILDQKGITYQV